MSIDVTVYKYIEIDVLKEKLGVLRETHKDLFEGPCILHDPYPIFSREQLEKIDSKVERYHQESVLLTSEEFGFYNAKSYLFASLDDTTFSEFNADDLEKFVNKILSLLDQEN